MINTIEPEAGTRRGRWVISAVAVLLVVGGAAFYASSTKALLEDVPLYEVARSDFEVTLVEGGEIRATKSERIVTPSVDGRLQIAYLWPEGGYVDVGDVVVEYDRTEHTSRLIWSAGELETAESNYERSSAEIEQKLVDLRIAIALSEANLELQEINLERAKLRSRVDLEEAKIHLEQARRGVTEAEENMRAEAFASEVDLRSQEMDVARKQGWHDKNLRNYKRLTVRAEHPGLVVYEKIRKNGQLRKVRVGDDLWDGTSIVSLPDLSKFQVIINVGEMDIEQLAVGQKSTVRLEAYPDMLLHGSVSKVLPMANPSVDAPNVQVFEVIIDIDEESSILRPGMSAAAEIVVESIPDAMTVPRGAIFKVDDLYLVYCLEGSSFSPRSIEMGLQNTVSVVVESGVEPGEKIALVDPTRILGHEKLGRD